VEFSINARPISSKDFNWEVGLNATYNKNKITKLINSNDPNYLGVKVGGIAGGTGNTIQIHSVGYAAGAFYVYEQVYDEAGKPIENLYVDRNGDGVVNEADMYHYKNSTPDVTMGINSRLSYKNWDFSFAGRLSLGNYNYNNVFSDRGTDKFLKHSNGYLSNIVSNWYNTGFTGSEKHFLSDYYVTNASFFKMDNITLGYNFDKPAKFISNLRVYGTVQNAFTITKYDGLDPEVYGGIDNNIYPRPRTFLFGVNLTF
jgi:iron complex outermembrane receptor protein